MGQFIIENGLMIYTITVSVIVVVFLCLGFYDLYEENKVDKID